MKKFLLVVSINTEYFLIWSIGSKSAGLLTKKKKDHKSADENVEEECRTIFQQIPQLEK